MWPRLNWIKVEPRREPSRRVQTKDYPDGKNSLLICKSGWSLRMDDFNSVGMRVAILAASGQGKSYLGGVIAEQLLENKRILIVMDPEGENYTLAERYRVIIMGRSPLLDEDGNHLDPLPVREAMIDINLVDPDPKVINAVLRTAIKDGISLVFDMSSLNGTAQRGLYAMIIGSLFLIKAKQRRLITLIVEEAQVFAPQKEPEKKEMPVIDGNSSLSISIEIAKRGRKKGINTIWMTQRPAALSKEVLSQSNIWFFGGVQTPGDVKSLKPYLEEAGITETQIRGQASGEFHFYTNAPTKDGIRNRAIKVRKRKCTHGGYTPTSEDDPLPPASQAQYEATIKKLKTVDTHFSD